MHFFSFVKMIVNFKVNLLIIVLSCSANRKIVALKEIRLQEEEGTPFTAIREGKTPHLTINKE